MECPICHASLTDDLYPQHLAAHRTLAAQRKAVTRYDCPQDCVITGSNPPPTCKHGKPIAVEAETTLK